MNSLGALLAVFVLAGGCGESRTEADGGPVADCGVSVRFEGRTYVEVGFTEVRAARAGRAVVASCEDIGENARGGYFDEHSAEVPLWSFPGHDATEVVGMQVDEELENLYRVLVREDRAEDLVAVLRSDGVLDADR